jgi:phospholipase C
MNYIRALLASTALIVGGCTASSGGNVLPGPSSNPSQPIQHIIVLFQENRSFNNLFAGFPGADTALSGKCNPSTQYCPKSGVVPLRTVRLESNEQFALGNDISHDHASFELECDPTPANLCRNDGFNQIAFGQNIGGPPAKLYPYAFVNRSETKAYWDFATQYGIADRMFFTETASSFIAHQEILSGTVRLNAHESLTDEPSAAPWGCDAPFGTVTAIIKSNGQVNEFGGPFPCFTQYGTLADLLDAKKVSWKFYVAPELTQPHGDFSGDVWNGFDAIKKIRRGPDWNINISRPNTNVLKDLKNGTLPSVSWVIPTLAESDHPASGCNQGPHWVTSVINAVGASKYWKSTAIVLLWDDWGGWFDNVPPPQTNYTSLGYRVPMIAISPFAIQHNVSHTQYEFGSILKFIEETFGLGSLNTTDATATSMSDMFDVTQTPTKYAPEKVPSEEPCGGSRTMEEIIRHDRGVPE